MPAAYLPTSYLNFWHPPRRSVRCARSGADYTYGREAMGPPIYSKTPYEFVKRLEKQNKRTIKRENTDPVYRGDVPGLDCVGSATTDDDSSDEGESEVYNSDEGESEVYQLTSPSSRSSSPESTLSTLSSSDASDTDMCASSPVSTISTRSSSPGSDMETHACSPDINMRASSPVSVLSTCSSSPGSEMRASSPDFDMRGSSPDFDMRGSSPDFDMRGSSPDFDMHGSSPDVDMRVSSPDVDMRASSPDSSRSWSTFTLRPTSPVSDMLPSSPDMQMQPSSPDFESRLRQTSPDTPRAPPPTTVERLGSPFTPIPARRLITYASRDRQRIRAQRSAEVEHANLVRAEAEAKVAARKGTPVRQPTRIRTVRARQPVRRSRRTRCGRIGDSTGTGVFLAEHLLSEGNVEHVWVDDKPRALVDSNEVIMAVVAGAPKSETSNWDLITNRVFGDMGRLYRYGDFTELGERESRVRFGVGYGEEYAAPHGIGNEMPNLREVGSFESSPSFKAISAYQNHLLQQFAPDMHAYIAISVNELIRREIAFPAFKNSVFTTSEVSFGDAPYPIHKNREAAFNTMEAVTVVGSWDHTKGGGILFDEDKGMVQLKPGATVLYPAGTKAVTFVAIAPHEKRYFFRQFVHAGVLRWVQKGGRSDTEFDNLASPTESAQWNALRNRRGRDSIKLFGKLGDVFVI